MKKINLFRPKILSRHPSHNILRAPNKKISLLPYKSVIRFGSSTEVPDTIANGGNRIEINPVSAIRISSNKLLMKQKFMEAKVQTADWMIIRNNVWCKYAPEDNENKHDQNFKYFEYDSSLSRFLTEMEFYPIVAKSYYGSKGRGNTLIRNEEEFTNWMVNKDLNNYIFEKFYNYALEYRVHVTKRGYFYTCRKALREDAPEDQRWRRHDDICVWFLEDNPEFRKPNSWNHIINDCVNALNQIGADVLSFDVRVQSERDNRGNLRNYQNYILLECNSASSMGSLNNEISVCAQKYIEEIPKIIIDKAKELNLYNI